MDRGSKRRIRNEVSNILKQAYKDMMSKPTRLRIKDGVGYIYMVDFSGQSEVEYLIGVVDPRHYSNAKKN